MYISIDSPKPHIGNIREVTPKIGRIKTVTPKQMLANIFIPSETGSHVISPACRASDSRVSLQRKAESWKPKSTTDVVQSRLRFGGAARPGSGKTDIPPGVFRARIFRVSQ